MKILWIVNTIFPYPAKCLNMKSTVLGGWLLSLLNSIKDKGEIQEIAIVTTYAGQKIKSFQDNKVSYYLIPCTNNNKYQPQIEQDLNIIYQKFQPDLIHIHGTEYPHSLAAVKASHNIKTVVSIQGLVSVYGYNENYNAQLSIMDMLKNITIRDIAKRDLLVYQAKKFRQRGKYEIECLQQCDYIIGRTSFDKAYTYAWTNLDKYHFCNESLRESFYVHTWDITKIQRHSIFISQASYPIKGLHQMLKAAYILKEKYNDLKIYVAGVDIAKLGSKTVKEKMKLTGYGKYIRKLIYKYGLENVVEFVGLLDADQMCSHLLKTHAFVQSSSVENSPNSLGEAMLLGVPCIASYVGGTADMLQDKEEGLLYPFNDYTMLSFYIQRLFEDDELAIALGKNASKKAHKTHSLKDNADRMIEIYKEVGE